MRQRVSSQGGGGTASAWQRYALADAVDSDGQSIVPGGFTANADETGFIDATMTTGVNAAAITAMAYVEWELSDADAAALASLRDTDIVGLMVQFLGAKLPDGARIGIALTVGGMAAATKGIAGGVYGSANGAVPWHAAFATAWSTPAAGGAADKLATCGQLQVLHGNSNTNLRISTSIRLTDDEISKQAATTTPLTSAAGGDFDRVALLIGNTASQASALSVSCGIKTFLKKVSSIARASRLSSIPAPVIRRPSDGDYGVLFMGHSMAHSTVVGNQAGGAVTSGYTYYNLDGLADATWDALSSPGHSLSPALLDGLAAISGNTGGYLVRRAASGAQLAATSVADEHLGGGVYDVADNGLDDPDVVVLWYGANDANGTEQQATDYLPALRREIEMIRERYPNAIIILPSEHTTAGYAYLASHIEAAKDTVESEYDHVYHVVYDYQTAGESADAIHPDADGHDAIGAGIATFLSTL